MILTNISLKQASAKWSLNVHLKVQVKMHLKVQVKVHVKVHVILRPPSQLVSNKMRKVGGMPPIQIPPRLVH